MLRRHLPALAAIGRVPALDYRVRQYFDLGTRHIMRELIDAGLSQADIVLCLLRIGTPEARRIVEALICRPITIAPACRLTWAYNKQAPSVRRQPVVTWVEAAQELPLRNKTKLAACYPEFRVGRTLGQLRMRGVSRGDIRRAIKRGWIRVAGAV